MPIELIVWDFDGVLNRNVVDGRAIWADTIKADLGLERANLSSYLFHSGRMKPVMRGRADFRDVVADWLTHEGSDLSPDALIAYWFEKDALPDSEVIGWLKGTSARHVIGTNNEARRAAFIEEEMGFSGLVEHVFASGRMGVAKPDNAFWEAIEAWSGLTGDRVLLIDDRLPNVEAAQAWGWQGYHFTGETRSGLPAVLEQI